MLLGITTITIIDLVVVSGGAASQWRKSRGDGGICPPRIFEGGMIPPDFHSCSWFCPKCKANKKISRYARREANKNFPRYTRRQTNKFFSSLFLETGNTFFSSLLSEPGLKVCQSCLELSSSAQLWLEKPRQS